MSNKKLSQFIADVVLTSHYLAEPVNKSQVEVTDAEIRCLKIIASFEPIGMHEIAEKMHASKPRATQLAALLEARSLVSRDVATDRRRIEVRATAKGKQVIKTLDARYEKLADAIEKKLGRKDTETLVRLLEEITPLTRLDT